MSRYFVPFKIDERCPKKSPRWSLTVRNAFGKAGVYIIRDRETREVLYVGRSFVDLGRTFRRHFNMWGESYLNGYPMNKTRVLFERDCVEVRFVVVDRFSREKVEQQQRARAWPHWRRG